jgi:hypothetical protein
MDKDVREGVREAMNENEAVELHTPEFIEHTSKMIGEGHGIIAALAGALEASTQNMLIVHLLTHRLGEIRLTSEEIELMRLAKGRFPVVRIHDPKTGDVVFKPLQRPQDA